MGSQRSAAAPFKEEEEKSGEETISERERLLGGRREAGENLHGCTS
jgi:hypothetical protein